MDYVYTIFNNFKYFYNSMNPATLSGAIDVIVVEQPDGTYMSTPFHVRFGKLSVFNSDDKFVDIQINGHDIAHIKMKLGDNGVAFFVEEIDGHEVVPEYLATSPLPGVNVDSDGERIDPLGSLPKKKMGQPSPRKNKKRLTQKSTSQGKRLAQTHKSFATDYHGEDLNPKQRLPFSSSIFSCRKYRSLPDLSFAAQTREDDSVKSATKKKGHMRKLTAGFIDRHAVDRSDIINPDDQEQPILTTPRGPQKPHPPSQPVTFSDSESDDELTGPVQPRPMADIADGALSDSEIDRQRFDTHNDPEWKWGEYPETKVKNDKKSAHDDKTKTTGWSWFRWRSRQPEKLDSATADDEEGVPLSSLIEQSAQMDPTKLEKYFGASCTSSCVDSGQGVSTTTSPSCPSAMSMESLIDENGSACALNASTSQETIVQPEPAVTPVLSACADTPVPPAADTRREPRVRHPQQPSDHARHSKQRSASGTSVGSDLSSADEEVRGFFSKPREEQGLPQRFKRTLRLQSDLLKALRLQYGSNDARFSITTKFQGTAWCSCHIYLLRWSERLVISDIDGTITRSDVLGHVIPAIGGTWAHAGVAELYTRIKNNGYRMVYLSSRAIGQSHYTKTYLQSIAQGSKMLPDGPVLLSPTSVLMAFRKEVIERKPEEFKIACLTDLKNLFPVNQPFYAGFGNRETDVKSYDAVGIPLERILIINPEGSLKRADKIGYVSTYASMAMETVDYLFPPLMRPEFVRAQAEQEVQRIEEVRHTNFTNPDKHSTFTHWRSRPDDYTFDDADFADYEKRREQCMSASKQRKLSKK